MEHIAAKASRLAGGGGGEKASFDEGAAPCGNLLAPLLEKASPGGKEKKAEYHFPLKPLDAACKSLFPQKKSDAPAAEKLTDDYKALADGLLEAIKNFPEYKEAGFESLRAVFSTLLSQFERFLIHVPLEANAPDISLFDHLKISAAIAEGLCLYHERGGSLTEDEIKRASEEKKWILACGDFSGIQKFIYNTASKNAAKSLAGRSLFIQLFCEAASEWILREMRLYPTSRIYSGGGKFYLLIASCLKGELREKADQINQVLFEECQGQIHLGLGMAELSEKDFLPAALSKKFKEAGQSLREDRKKKFLSLIQSRPENFFEPQKASANVCHICGFDGLEKKEDICGQCKTFKDLGRSAREIIQKKDAGLLWVWSREDARAIAENLDINGHKEMEFDIFSHKGSPPDKSGRPFCRLYVIESLKALLKSLQEKGIYIKNSHFEFVNSIEAPRPAKGLSFGHRFIASCDDLRLDEMAEKSRGIGRIGVLRMDVDNLGGIFADGLKRSGQNSGDLSRKAALSRQLNGFFSGYLTGKGFKEEALPRDSKSEAARGESGFQGCEILYAGGDDLFAVGPWDQLPDMAFQIKEKFKAYCCDNPDLTLSAGISVFPAKYPLLAGAHAAGEAEDKAKNFNRAAWGGGPAPKAARAGAAPAAQKNALCFLDTVIGWDEYKDVKKFKKLIEGIMEGANSRSLLQALYHADREIKREINGAGGGRGLAGQEDLIYRPWRHRFVYYIARLLERSGNNKGLREDIHKLKDEILCGCSFSGNSQSADESQGREAWPENSAAGESEARPARDWLFLPVCWADYLKREKSEKNSRKERKKA